MNRVYFNEAKLNVVSLNSAGVEKRAKTIQELWEEFVTSGAISLSIEGMKKDSISALKVYGGAMLSGTPSPSAPVDIVSNKGAIFVRDADLPKGYARLSGMVFDDGCYFKIDGFRLTSEDTLRVSFTPTKACNLLGCYTTTDAEDNYSIYLTTTAGGKYLRFNGGTYLSTVTAGTRYDVVVTPTGATGFGSASSWSKKDFVCSVDMLIGTTSTSATSAKFDGVIHGNIVVDGRLNLIPCERLSDGVIGYYDSVGGVFYAPAVGTTTMGAYDGSFISEVQTVGEDKVSLVSGEVYDGKYRAVDFIQNDASNFVDTGIVINGGDVAVEMDVQFDDINAASPEMAWGYMGGSSNIPRWGFGVYSSKWLGSPNATTSVGAPRSDRMHTYLWVKTEGSAMYYGGEIDGEELYKKSSMQNASLFLANDLPVYIFARNNGGNAGNFSRCKVYGFKVIENDKITHDLRPAMDADGNVGFYDAVEKTFVYGDGLLAGSEKMTTVASVYAEMLLAVGSHRDAQDIVSGEVTRKVGIKVLDGTESGWTKGSNKSADGNGVFYIALNDRANNDTSLKLISSHYSFAGTVSYTTLKLGEMSITQTTKNVYFEGGGIESVSDWKAYLAEQYAKGTPVKVVYPLGAEVVENVASQKLDNPEGDCTIARTAEIDGLEMEITCKVKPKE